MRFESDFKSSFGNVKAFNLKKLKLLLSSSQQWPEAALLLGAMAGQRANSLGRAQAGPSLG